MHVGTGVPQGSIIGPDLFSIYTSSFPDCLERCKYHFYADDTVIYHSFFVEQSADAVRSINRDLDKLAKFSALHCLELNPLKCSMIVIGNRKTRNVFMQTNSVIEINNSRIQMVEKMKVLGLVLDCNLNFKDHITKLLRGSYGKLKMLYPNRHLLNMEAKLMLCDSLVLSVFNHCDLVYGPCLRAVDVERVQRVQKSCLRFVYGVRRRERISHKLIDAGWLNMADRRMLHTACRLHHVLLTGTPPYLCNKITFRTHVHNLNLRHRGVVTIPRHRSQLFKHSFSYVAAKVLNKIPFDYAICTKLMFKKRMKQYLREPPPSAAAGRRT